jgi:hypothetical protein
MLIDDDLDRASLCKRADAHSIHMLERILEPGTIMTFVGR